MGPLGTLRHFTVVRYRHPAHRREPPFAYGIIDLDGGGRAITHFIDAPDLGSLRSGMRVEPIFREERKGSILDIEYFAPVAEGGR